MTQKPEEIGIIGRWTLFIASIWRRIVYALNFSLHARQRFEAKLTLILEECRKNNIESFELGKIKVKLYNTAHLDMAKLSPSKQKWDENIARQMEIDDVVRAEQQRTMMNNAMSFMRDEAVASGNADEQLQDSSASKMISTAPAFDRELEYSLDQTISEDDIPDLRVAN